MLKYAVSRARTTSLWVPRVLMLPAAFMGFVGALWLEYLPTYKGAVPSRRLAQQVCWGETFGEATACAVGAAVFVMLPVLLEPKEKFSVAAIFYTIGALIVMLGAVVFSSVGFGQLWPMIFPPLITGLLCTVCTARLWGYGSAARFFSASSPKVPRAARFRLVLRRALLIPLVLAAVFTAVQLSEATQTRIFGMCLRTSYYAGDDSVPEACSATHIRRLLALNDYGSVAVQTALAICLAALLEPKHKHLAARLVWLVGGGVMDLLTLLLAFTIWKYTAVIFAVGAVCVWVIGYYYPADRVKKPEAA